VKTLTTIRALAAKLRHPGMCRSRRGNAISLIPRAASSNPQDGYIQGYNAQAAVDAQVQIIVDHTLSTNGNDQSRFASLLHGIKASLGTVSLAADQGLHRARTTPARQQVSRRKEGGEARLACRARCNQPFRLIATNRFG
jgi:hypothetical protein